MTCRLVVLVSGGGTNLQALLDAAAAGTLKARVVAVFANRRTAYGLERAAAAGVPAHYVPLKPFREAGRTRREYDGALAERVAAYDPDLVVLAGWMHILSADFLDRFAGRVINLHPALPGAFPGTDAIRRSYEAFRAGQVSHGGIMIHYAVPEVDAGPVVAQRIIPIHPEDTLADFEQRLHAAEHELIVEATALACRQGGTDQAREPG